MFRLRLQVLPQWHAGRFHNVAYVSCSLPMSVYLFIACAHPRNTFSPHPILFQSLTWKEGRRWWKEGEESLAILWLNSCFAPSSILSSHFLTSSDVISVVLDIIFDSLCFLSSILGALNADTKKILHIFEESSQEFVGIPSGECNVEGAKKIGHENISSSKISKTLFFGPKQWRHFLQVLESSKTEATFRSSNKNLDHTHTIWQGDKHTKLHNETNLQRNTHWEIPKMGILPCYSWLCFKTAEFSSGFFGDIIWVDERWEEEDRAKVWTTVKN